MSTLIDPYIQFSQMRNLPSQVQNPFRHGVHYNKINKIGFQREFENAEYNYLDIHKPGAWGSHGVFAQDELQNHISQWKIRDLLKEWYYNYWPQTLIDDRNNPQGDKGQSLIEKYVEKKMEDWNIPSNATYYLMNDDIKRALWEEVYNKIVKSKSMVLLNQNPVTIEYIKSLTAKALQNADIKNLNFWIASIAYNMDRQLGIESSGVYGPIVLKKFNVVGNPELKAIYDFELDKRDKIQIILNERDKGKPGDKIFEEKDLALITQLQNSFDAQAKAATSAESQAVVYRMALASVYDPMLRLYDKIIQKKREFENDLTIPNPKLSTTTVGDNNKIELNGIARRMVVDLFGAVRTNPLSGDQLVPRILRFMQESNINNKMDPVQKQQIINLSKDFQVLSDKYAGLIDPKIGEGASVLDEEKDRIVKYELDYRKDLANAKGIKFED